MSASTAEFVWSSVFLLAAVIAYLHIVSALRALHVSTNSRLDELLKATQDLARREGFEAGGKDEKLKRFEEIERASHVADPQGGQ